MDANRDNSAPNQSTEKAPDSPEPLFRRYQIKIKTDTKLGAVPLGRWPLF